MLHADSISVESARRLPALDRGAVKSSRLPDAGGLKSLAASRGSGEPVRGVIESMTGAASSTTPSSERLGVEIADARRSRAWRRWR